MRNKLACPYCGSKDNSCTETRWRPKYQHVYRSRLCASCRQQWSSVEISSDAYADIVKKAEKAIYLQSLLAALEKLRD